jgi:protein involved in polysaccharide export with SLBB domain
MFSLSESKAETNATESYRIAVDDVLLIDVIDHPELKTVVKVASDGTIAFPYIGMVKAKGRDLSEIEAEITKRLREGYINFAVVSVKLEQSLKRQIYVLGEVNRALHFDFLENLTVLNAITIAGDLTMYGRYGSAKIRRKQTGKSGYQEIDVDLKSSQGRDMLLQPDDILIVERKTFFVRGETGRVGEFPLERDTTVLIAITMAGDLTPNGHYGSAKIRRKQNGKSEYQEIDIDLKGSQGRDMLLQPDDILTIERNTFFVYGETGRVGEFPLERDTTLIKALAIAGGLSEHGLYGKVKVRRTDESGNGYKNFEVDIDSIKAGGDAGDIFIQPGDILFVERNKTIFIEGEVGRQGEYPLEKDMTVLKMISIAGGITPDGIYGSVKVKRKEDDKSGFKEIEIDLQGGPEGGATGNMLLQPDDVVIVERNDQFYIYGEVNRPGQYVLQKNMTAFNAISIAGGFTKWGAPNRVEVLRLADNKEELVKIKVNINDVLKGNAAADMPLKPGDTLVVSAGVF